MEKSSILIVEDEIKIAKILRDYLIKDYPHTFMIHDGNHALEYIENNVPDLIILDIMLPGIDGLKLCKKIREFSQVPIIFLTAKTEELDKLVGFELEADDYITKPFSPKEVVARVQAILKRVDSQTKTDNSKVISKSDVVVNNETREVKVSGKYIKLTPKEFEILKTLIAKPNRIFTREDLLNVAMGYDYEGYDRTIDTHVKNLRKKILLADPNKNCIESIYGVGYRFNSNLG